MKLSRSIGVLLLAILTFAFGLFSGVRQTHASAGNILRSIFVDVPTCSYFSAGIAFDGKELLLSCTESNLITRVDPSNGKKLGEYIVNGISLSGGFAGMSWDAQNNQLWVGSAQVTPQKIYTVTLDSTTKKGTATFRFTHAQGGGETWLSGLAFDPIDGTLWLGQGGQTKIYHYSQTGDLLGSFDAAKFAPQGKTGLAVVSAAKLYVANDGKSQIFSVNKNGSSPLLFANVPAGKRVEDLECDSVTFAPKSAIWSNYSFDNHELNAFEVPSGDCLTVEVSPPPPPPPPPPSPPPAGKTPLILIPGIGGSELKTTEMKVWSENDGHGGIFNYLYSNNETVWLNESKAGEFGEDDYFDVLRMKTDGITSEANIGITGSLVARAYQGAIDFFTANGYVLNKDFFVFPYDWRKDIALTASLLDQKINEIKAQTGSPKVDIVAHSMGGLVARNYISDAVKASKVRRLFTLGTPHLGAVKSLKALKHGDCLAFEIGNFCLSIAPSEVKDVLQNMISGYELAPSQKYFNFYSGEDKNYPFPYKTETGGLNYPQIKNLLTGFGHNTSLFAPSEVFHDLDNSLSNTNGVEVTVIAGSGKLTLGQIIEEKTTSLLGIESIHKDILNINGDETVPLFSASLIDPAKSKSLLGNAKVFYVNEKHGEMVANGPALNLVKNILENSDKLPDGVYTEPYSFGKSWLFSSHSPVNMHVYDSLNNHTGLTSDGNFEANIPGSSYDTLDNAKFIYLPDGGNYSVKFEATDEGSFDFKIKKYEDDTISQEILYKDIPLESSTKAEAQVDTASSAAVPVVHLDEDGNGTIDQDVEPTSNLTGDAIFDKTVPQTTAVLDGVKGINDWYRSDVKVTLQAKDETGGSGILRTEYSLDNGATVNIYTEPLVFSSEKISKIKFRSIDRAGNEESPKEIEIKIDRIVPEAKVFIDPSSLNFILQGVDANPTTVKREGKTASGTLSGFHRILDEAGNSLLLYIREEKGEKQKRNEFRIYSLKYSNNLAVNLPPGYLNVLYQGANNVFNITEQNFELKKEVKIRIQYDKRKNKSTIMVKEGKKEKIKEIKNGFILLQLLTDKGQLKTSYQ